MSNLPFFIFSTIHSRVCTSQLLDSETRSFSQFQVQGLVASKSCFCNHITKGGRSIKFNDQKIWCSIDKYCKITPKLAIHRNWLNDCIKYNICATKPFTEVYICACDGSGRWALTCHTSLPEPCTHYCYELSLYLCVWREWMTFPPPCQSPAHTIATSSVYICVCDGSGWLSLLLARALHTLLLRAQSTYLRVCCPCRSDFRTFLPELFVNLNILRSLTTKLAHRSSEL